MKGCGGSARRWRSAVTTAPERAARDIKAARALDCERLLRDAGEYCSDGTNFMSRRTHFSDGNVNFSSLKALFPKRAGGGFNNANDDPPPPTGGHRFSTGT